MVCLLFLIFPVAQCRWSVGGVHLHGGCCSQREFAKWPQVIVWGVGRAVRASKLLPVQFKTLSQTVRPFIRECILYYGV